MYKQTLCWTCCSSDFPPPRPSTPSAQNPAMKSLRLIALLDYKSYLGTASRYIVSSSFSSKISITSISKFIVARGGMDPSLPSLPYACARASEQVSNDRSPFGAPWVQVGTGTDVLACLVRVACQDRLLAHAHGCKALLPATNELPLPDSKIKGLAAPLSARILENLSILEPAHEMLRGVQNQKRHLLGDVMQQPVYVKECIPGVWRWLSYEGTRLLRSWVVFPSSLPNS